MRTWTVIKPGNQQLVYEGFDKDFNTPFEFVAVVDSEGETEVFVLENPNTASLLKYLATRTFSRLIGVFEKL